MPKNPNSRPDIQVLEDRVVRLKKQIEEISGFRYYKATRQRLAKVCQELEYCTELLIEASGDSYLASQPTSSDPNPIRYADTSFSEFASDGTDLADTFSIEVVRPSGSKHSPKEIVSIFSKKMQDCADTTGCSSGIIQVNQFCQVMNQWYQSRFTPSEVQRNPKFTFKSSSIVEYVDLLMVAGGRALNQGMFPEFVSDIHLWISQLNTPKDTTWALPYSVMQIKGSNPSCYTMEAVLLEKILKPSLYDESFYNDHVHTIEETYSSTFDIYGDDISLDNIIHSCPHLTVTSSFDATKYGAAS